jgi:tRNA 2-selenouridine synthase SelU
MEAEQKSKEEIILDYPLLTEDEKTEILTSIGNGEV